MILMADDRCPVPPWDDDEGKKAVAVDARSSTERLNSALTRIERVLREFDARLAWK